MTSSDRRSYEVCEAERKMVGLGRSISAGFAAVIVFGMGAMIGVVFGIGIGALVFRP